ncbi:MAG: hypothetical protein H6983_22940 [Ectothiorhodospiraceae bacterium]|nr:hypothetical protein [Chromatiales bacterium]MCP5157053.1 hypothetical protein [Ectothiorhodospiraceae bacterium]
MRGRQATSAAVVLAWLLAQPALALSPTVETHVGPMYLPDAPADPTLWRPGDPGERLLLTGRVLSPAARPVAGAVVEIWQADGDGNYRPDRYRATLRTAPDGTFHIRTALPGYVWRERHIHVVVSHPDHPRLVTRVTFSGDPRLADSWWPSLAIALDRTRVDDGEMLVGDAVIVLGGH